MHMTCIANSIFSNPNVLGIGDCKLSTQRSNTTKLYRDKNIRSISTG